MEEDLLFREYLRERFLLLDDILHTMTVTTISLRFLFYKLSRFICALPRGARVFFFFDTCSP